MGVPGCPRPARAHPAPDLQSAISPRSCPRAAGRSPGRTRASGSLPPVAFRPAACKSPLPSGLREPAPPASTPHGTALRSLCHSASSTARVPTAGRGRAGFTWQALRVLRHAWRSQLSGRDSAAPAGRGKHFSCHAPALPTPHGVRPLPAARSPLRWLPRCRPLRLVGLPEPLPRQPRDAGVERRLCARTP